MSQLEVKYDSTTRIRWKISNFSTVAARDNIHNSLYSDDFRLDSSSVKCYLRFEPTNRDSLGDSDHSSIFLHVRDFANMTTLELSYRFWVENELGDAIRDHRDDSDRVFDQSRYTSWGYYNFIHRNKLYSENNQFVRNDVVILCCRIYRRDVSMQSETSFIRNFWSMYKEGLTGECTLKVSDGEFQVSKTLLAAHSDVFKGMFHSGMQEETTGIIKIDDMDSKTTEALLEYLHTESVSNLDEVALELFKAADKYKITRLMNQCADNLGRTIDENNLGNRLIVAFMHKSDVLKLNILDALARAESGIFMSMMASSEWFHFTVTNEELAKEITTAVFTKLNYRH